MAHYSKLVTAFAFLFSVSAYAGYAQVSPPPNWSALVHSAGGTPGQFGVRIAANDVLSSGVIRSASSAVLNVGGRPVVMPVAYRLAANAGRVGAIAIGLNPYLALGLGAAAWLASANIGLDQSDNTFHNLVEPTRDSSTTYVLSTGEPCPDVHCMDSAMLQQGYVLSEQRFESAPNGGFLLKATGKWTWHVDAFAWGVIPVTTDGGLKCNPGFRMVGDYCMEILPIRPEDFPQKLSEAPIPSRVPSEMPDVVWPVESPIINPSPGSNPVSRPLRVPQGEPQLVPNSDPKRWQQPSIDIVPSPTPDSPWRVDVQPKKIETSDGQPLPPTSTPNTNKPFLPDGAPNPDYNPAQEPSTNEKPTPEEQQDLCQKNPDILACQKPNLGSVEPSEIPDTSRSLSIDKDSGWGPENGTCPPPKTVQVLGVTLEMPFTMLCDFAAGIRPLLIAFAWLSAIGGFIGIGRRE